MKTKKCLSCSKELTGRIDKKFCDTYCRNQFHNRNKEKYEYTIKEINKLLRKNRSILAYFCPSGKTTIRKEIAEEMGYDFSYFTNVIKFKSQNYFFCYDYGFYPFTDAHKIRKLTIVPKQKCMESKTVKLWKG